MCGPHGQILQPATPPPLPEGLETRGMSYTGITRRTNPLAASPMRSAPEAKRKWHNKRKWRLAAAHRNALRGPLQAERPAVAAGVYAVPRRQREERDFAALPVVEDHLGRRVQVCVAALDQLAGALRQLRQEVLGVGPRLHLVRAALAGRRRKSQRLNAIGGFALFPGAAWLRSRGLSDRISWGPDLGFGVSGSGLGVQDFLGSRSRVWGFGLGF
jgi:hypothetical protein